MIQLLFMLMTLASTPDHRLGYSTVSIGGEVVAVTVCDNGISVDVDPLSWSAPTPPSGSKSSKLSGSVYDAVLDADIDVEVVRGETETAGAFLDRFFEMMDKLDKEVRERATKAGIDYERAKAEHKKPQQVGLIFSSRRPRAA